MDDVQSCLSSAKSNLGARERVNSGPEVNAEPLQQRKSAIGGATHTNLNEAMKATSFAWGLYWLFARKAASTGHPDLGVLFHDLARLEREDHFNRAANLYGLVGDPVANLTTSIKGETTAHEQYSHDRDQAKQANDSHAASFFNDAAGDEAHHKEDFEIFLHRLQRA